MKQRKVSHEAACILHRRRSSIPVRLMSLFASAALAGSALYAGGVLGPVSLNDFTFVISW